MKFFTSKFTLNTTSILLFSLLLIIVSINEFILGGKSLDLGFFTDDWLFLSHYREFVANPILDILVAWKNIGSHNFSHSYYMGLLHFFFGLDFTAYRYFNLILKIFAVLSLYPLVLILFRNKPIAALATFIYSIHFSSFGMLDGPSRGEDFIGIIFMNFFFLIYMLLRRKGEIPLIYLLGLTIIFSTTIFIDPTRFFPLIFFVVMLEIYKFILNRKFSELKTCMRHVFILLSPFLFVFIFTPQAIIPELLYFVTKYKIMVAGNFQLLLVPFASFGSMFLPKDYWSFFGKPDYTNFINYLFYAARPCPSPRRSRWHRFRPRRVRLCSYAPTDRRVSTGACR